MTTIATQNSGARSVASVKMGNPSLVFGRCRKMRKEEFGTGNGEGEKADGKCQVADDRGQMADDGCRMPDGRGRKAIDEWQMADDECEVAAGGCDEGQSSEPMTEGSSGPVVGYDSQRVTEDATDDKCRLQAEWAPLWETSGYHLSGCGADCSTTLGIKAVRRLDSRPLRDCRADQGRIDSLSGPGPMFR